MSNQVALALNEYMKNESVGAFQVMQKYNVSPSDFWAGYKELKGVKDESK